MNTPPRPTERATASERASLFDCAFVWAPNELPGPEPYVIFEDERSEPFAAELIQTCRGIKGFGGVVRDAAALEGSSAVVFCEGPVWARNRDALIRAGVHGSRARVLLYFDRDPSGCWDFAQACGPTLARIFHERGVDADSVAALSSFLETWAGARVSNGRIAPLAKFTTREFLPDQIENGTAIARVMAAMADDESRAAYARILFGTAEQVVQAFSQAVFGGQQYMEIVEPQPGDVIVNCGVGRGWELPYFLARLKGDGHIHNVDPNIQYPHSLYAEFIAAGADMITDHGLILGERDGVVRLDLKDAGMIISDGASDAGADAETFPCRSLDSLMTDGFAERLDYLKMDVEGGERAILAGALETIRAHRPKLAVAIYHEPHHFWEYPCFLLDHLEDYRFYLRQYGYSRFETLLYAVPAEATVTRSGGERLRHARRTRRTSEASAQPLVLAYLHDAPDAPRAVYSRTRRAVTRAYGVDWETAELAPAPWIDADELFGVVETPRGAVLLTLHEPEPRRLDVTVGLAERATEIRWIDRLSVPTDSVCRLVDSADGAVRFLIHIPSEAKAKLFRFDGAAIVEEHDFPLAHDPLAVYEVENGIRVAFIDDDGVLAETDMNGARFERASPPGRLLGLVTLVHHGVETHRARGWAFLDPCADDIIVAEHNNDGGWAEAARISHDPRLGLVATLVKDAALRLE